MHNQACNDPLVLVHARALLTSTREGVTEYIEADLNDPAAIIAAARATLDFSRPVAVTLLGILHFIRDDDEARDGLAREDDRATLRGLIARLASFLNLPGALRADPGLLIFLGVNPDPLSVKHLAASEAHAVLRSRRTG